LIATDTVSSSARLWPDIEPFACSTSRSLGNSVSRRYVWLISLARGPLAAECAR
jgi:hypothetical protein